MKKSRVLSVLAAAALVCAAGGALAGCAPEPDPGKKPGPQSSEANADAGSGTQGDTEADAAANSGGDSAAGAEGDGAAGADVTPPAQWQRVSDARGPVTFELPPGWSFAPSGGDNAYGIFGGDVRDGSGNTKLIYSNRVQGLGGACPPELPKVQVAELDVTPVNIAGYAAADNSGRGDELGPPRFAYRLAEFEGGVLASMSLTDRAAVSNTCMFYNLVSTTGFMGAFTTNLQVDTNTRPGFYPSRAEAEAYMQTDEYATIKRILLTVGFSA